MSALAPIIPIKPYQKNRLRSITEPRSPEPAPLYSLVTLALVLHVPMTVGGVCDLARPAIVEVRQALKDTAGLVVVGADPRPPVTG